MSCLEEWLVKNLDKIKTNMTAGEELSSAFASSATNLARRDQAECVRNLKSGVLAEVKYLLDMESSAKSGGRSTFPLHWQMLLLTSLEKAKCLSHFNLGPWYRMTKVRENMLSHYESGSRQ